MIQDRRDRALHGLTTWTVVTILMFMLLTTAIGRVIGGTASMVASGLQHASTYTLDRQIGSGAPVVWARLCQATPYTADQSTFSFPSLSLTGHSAIAR